MDKIFMLAFDHRSSFVKQVFGFDENTLTRDQAQKVVMAKKIIYQGFKKALEGGLPKDFAAMLVDEEYGDEVLRDAKKQNYNFALPVEKSGQNEFDFFYGENFAEHIEKYDPTFVKVLVRFNPKDNADTLDNQIEKLKILAEYCQMQNKKFLFELLVPATQNQLDSIDNDLNRYENELRPGLTQQAISQLQDAGIKPDIWKIEGCDKKADYEAIINEIKKTNPQAKVIILGRGESKEKVTAWLNVGKNIPEIIGFAIGRTIFQSAISLWNKNEISIDQTIDLISKNYLEFYHTFNA